MNGFSRYLLSALLLLLAGIASAEIETVTWLHTDHLGSPLMARDSQGNTLWQEDYSPWGERLALPSANSADIGYTGHYEEADIGLTYAQARWYDPAVGRFLSADPVSLHVGGVAFFGRYTYANHSPYVYWDPDGRASRSEEWAALDGAGSDPGASLAAGAEAVGDGAAAIGDAVEPDLLSAVPGGYLLSKLKRFLGVAGDVSKKLSTGAESATSAARLRGQLIGQEIAGGHAFEKHVLQKGEFRGLGIRTREQFASHIENVVNNPTATRPLSGGRTAFWDDTTSTVVIRNPRAADGGTAFQPANGRAYFDGLR